MRVERGMQRFKTYEDKRLGGVCFNCGSLPTTRDHAPPKVFLDKPYPKNIIKVGSCGACNAVTSSDEQYLACLIEVTLRGSTDPDDLQRSNIAKTLRRAPALRSRLDQARYDIDGSTGFRCELERVNRVLEKMARGLWYFDHAEALTDAYAICRWWPAPLSPEQETDFFQTSGLQLLPEIGSHAFVRTLLPTSMTEPSKYGDGWVDIQEGRFSYSTDDSRVRMILSDYLFVDVQIIH